MGLHGMCSDLASYKHRTFKEGTPYQRGPKVLWLLLQGDCFMMEQEKKDYLQLLSPDKSGTAFGKWLVISHCALCTKPRLIDLLHKLNAFINNEHSSGTLLPLLHLTPLFLHFWNPGSSKAGKSSWWVGHYCRLTLQSQHTIHSTEKK